MHVKVKQATVNYMSRRGHWF